VGTILTIGIVTWVADEFMNLEGIDLRKDRQSLATTD